MKLTTDTLTGKGFRWNETVREQDTGLLVPCREDENSSTWLHPSRVPAELLRELNPGVNIEEALR